MTMTPPCPAHCGRTCGIHPLCDHCWNRLPASAQLALCHFGDPGSPDRHQQLRNQLAAGIPVSDIQIHSRTQRPKPRHPDQLSLFDTTV